jgi:hypothetical protein
MEAFAKLQTRNWQAFAAHSISFVLLLILYLLYQNTHKFAQADTFRYALPTTDDISGGCNSQRDDESNKVGKCSKDELYTVPKKTIWSFNIIYGCLFFFGFTALAHAFYATDGFLTGAYSAVIKQGWNPYRWFEYGVSASTMSLLIGHALGTKDAPSLGSAMLMTASIQAFGFIVESNLKSKSLNSDVVIASTAGGWLLLLALWGPFIYNFKAVNEDINNNYNTIIDPSTGKIVKLPSWVWFIILVQFINYASYGVIQLLQVRAALKGTPKNFIDVEKQYLLLSFAGKLGLAGGLSYGLIFRTRDCA